MCVENISLFINETDLLKLVVLFYLLRNKKPVSSATVYQIKPIYDNESAGNIAQNVHRDQTQDGRTYEGLDSSQRKADDVVYEALDV